jgi:hypothetical protein
MVYSWALDPVGCKCNVIKTVTLKEYSRDQTARPRQPEQKARQTARTGQPGQDIQERKAGQDIWGVG